MLVTSPRAASVPPWKKEVATCMAAEGLGWQPGRLSCGQPMPSGIEIWTCSVLCLLGGKRNENSYIASRLGENMGNLAISLALLIHKCLLWGYRWAVLHHHSAPDGLLQIQNVQATTCLSSVGLCCPEKQNITEIYKINRRQ